jgi:hypothetical protein
MAKLSWQPRHEDVKLRDELKMDKPSLHLFAADRDEVMMQNDKRPI